MMSTLALVCAGCSHGANPVDANSLPLNPHPGPTVEIIGDIPTHFAVDRFRVVYGTNSPSASCNGANYPDGGPFPLWTEIYVSARRAGDEVATEIEPDRYLPGPCRWQIEGVHAILRNGDGETTEPLVAIDHNWSQRYAARGDAQQVGQTATFYCGRKHGAFGCSDGPPGDSSYLPVQIKAGDRQARFVVHNSGYRAPSG